MGVSAGGSASGVPPRAIIRPASNHGSLAVTDFYIGRNAYAVGACTANIWKTLVDITGAGVFNFLYLRIPSGTTNNQWRVTIDGVVVWSSNVVGVSYFLPIGDPHGGDDPVTFASNFRLEYKQDATATPSSDYYTDYRTN